MTELKNILEENKLKKFIKIEGKASGLYIINTDLTN